jgi:predicted transcriptional regulator
VPLGVDRVRNSLGFDKRTQNRIIDRLIQTGFIFEQRHGMGSIRRRLKINYPKLNREMERVYEERVGIT